MIYNHSCLPMILGHCKYFRLFQSIHCPLNSPAKSLQSICHQTRKEEVLSCYYHVENIKECNGTK